MDLKSELAKAVRVLSRGEVLTQLFGHISVRLEETPDEFYILGHVHSEGKLLTDITADDIVRVNLDGEKLEGRVSPPGERFIHTEIYKKFPHIKAVIHGHPTLPVAFSVAGQEILPVEHRAVIFYPAVKILDLPAQINTPELGQRVAEALGDNLALMLRHHGVVVVGQSIEGVCSNAFTLQRNALIQYLAMSLGKEPHAVRPEEVREGFKKDLSSIWPYYEKTYGDEEE
jgi:ribulose-5-phosphate 4-epimerase/fuculose-1-phosphate aldolase